MISALIFAISLARPAYSAPVETCGHAEMYRRAFAAGLSPSMEKPWLVRKLEGLTDTDVISNSLAVEPNFSTHAITGTNTMVVQSLVNGLNQFHVRLGNNLPVSSVTLDGRPVTATFEDASHLRIDFDQAYNTGQTFTLVINYSGVTQSSGFGSIVFGTHSGASYCFTLSEPWLAYTWWPNKDDNTDKALMSIAVTVPNTMSVAANGILQGTDTLSGNRLRFRWQSAYPMSPYLLCFGATNFNHFSDTYTYATGTMPLEFYIWPENDTTGNRTGWLHVKQMLATLGDWYGPYPFMNEKYGIYQFSFGGGQEHQTMTGENSFGDNLSVHELGHQWWGDNITCLTWSDIWLNEGFATYTEAVWLEKLPGSTGLPALKAAMQARKPSSVNGTVYVPPGTTDINRIFSGTFTYNKGGWVLHMLRHVLGDTTFWNGMALYRSQHSLGTAITADFQHSMEKISGRNLTGFFQEWVYLPGAPQYQVGWTNITIGSQNFLAMHVKQVQSGTYPTFAMPIDVRATAGSTLNAVVQNDATIQNYLIPTPAPTTALTLDPDGWILNTGIASVAYVPGPPKVINSYPAPGGTYDRAKRIYLQFHTQVTMTSSDVTLKRLSTNEIIPVAVMYYPQSKTWGINPFDKLPPDNYELRVADTVTALDSGQTLDGEWTGAYPSGDGKPGGALVIPFTVP